MVIWAISQGPSRRLWWTGFKSAAGALPSFLEKPFYTDVDQAIRTFTSTGQSMVMIYAVQNCADPRSLLLLDFKP